MSSLLGERDDGREEDIRSYSLDQLREMAKRGELGQTRADAEEIELDDSFWKHAKWTPPLLPGKTSVHLRVDRDVLDWFKDQGKGHLTRMNHVLRAYYEASRRRGKHAAPSERQRKKSVRA
jgi:uncharacterized protein (DUF4415 family)